MVEVILSKLRACLARLLQAPALYSTRGATNHGCSRLPVHFDMREKNAPMNSVTTVQDAEQSEPQKSYQTCPNKSFKFV